MSPRQKHHGQKPGTKRKRRVVAGFGAGLEQKLAYMDVHSIALDRKFKMFMC